MAKHQREQLVTAFENAVVVRAHILFIILTWPSKINRCFPFHVRTTQIGAMMKSNVVVGSTKVTFATKRAVTANPNRTGSVGIRGGFVGESLDRFTQHQYAPTSSIDPNALILRPPTGSISSTSGPKSVPIRASVATVRGFGENPNNSMPDVG
jgi:hypothetical protein